MNALTLYRKYLHNSLIGQDNEYKAKRLSEEREIINGIFKGVDSYFYGDKALKDKTDRSIYSLIKKEIICEMARDKSKIFLIAVESKYYLASIINEIDEILVSLNG